MHAAHPARQGVFARSSRGAASPLGLVASLPPLQAPKLLNGHSFRGPNAHRLRSTAAPPYHTGLRFSMKACTPSSAAASIMLQAMVCPASV